MIMCMPTDSILLRDNWACGAFFFWKIGPAALYSIFESYFRSKFHQCFKKRFGQNLLFSYSIISFDEGSGLSKEIGGRSTKKRSFPARVMSILNMFNNFGLSAHYYSPSFTKIAVVTKGWDRVPLCYLLTYCTYCTYCIYLLMNYAFLAGCDSL